MAPPVLNRKYHLLIGTFSKKGYPSALKTNYKYNENVLYLKGVCIRFPVGAGNDGKKGPGMTRE